MKQYTIIAIAAITILSACGKKTQETKPIRKNITETVFASGILEAKNTYSLTAQADGYLVAVNFTEGDIVEAGKVLAVVDNKESGFNKEIINIPPQLPTGTYAIELSVGNKKISKKFIKY